MSDPTEVKDISADGKTCKIYQDVDGTYITELISGDLFVGAGPFSTIELAEAKGAELIAAEHISGDMLVGDVGTTE